MTERWQAELTKLRGARLPADLWDRVAEGPRMEPPGPPPRSRVAAVVAAFVVFALGGVLVWRALAPTDTSVRSLAGPEVLEVPPRGEVAAVFLPDGRPVFVVHHEDGSVSVVDVFSSHRPWGLRDLVAWCPSTRQFVEIGHEARFDEFGNWQSAGPAPSGLATFAVDDLARDANGDPSTIQVGAIQPPSPGGSAPETEPTRPPLCPAEAEPATSGTTPVTGGVSGDVGFVVVHAIGRADVWGSPAAAAAAEPDGWIAVEGQLLVARDDGFVQLCAEVQGERCLDGAIVRGIDGVGLLVNVLIPYPDFYAEDPGIWIARVEDGVLRDLARLELGQVS